MSFIVTRELTKNYFFGKTNVPALRNINLTISKGEYLCVIGPSGSGKSTLLNLLGLIDQPTSGELLFDNQNVLSLNDKGIHRFRKKNITFIFQSFNLIPVLTAYENIEFPLLIQGVARKERHKRIEQLSEEVGINQFLKHKPDELSGGQRQRVAIARALVIKPGVILADEPTANLDSVTGNVILDLLRRLNREEKTTFVIASHDPKLMQQADRVIKIMDGKVVA